MLEKSPVYICDLSETENVYFSSYFSTLSIDLL